MDMTIAPAPMTTSSGALLPLVALPQGDLLTVQRTVFPHCRVEILPGVGHWAWLEKPDQVAELVIPFLRAQMTHPIQSQ
jgi:pimeloyl-ACP methyl ester carboxylesterase